MTRATATTKPTRRKSLPSSSRCTAPARRVPRKPDAVFRVAARRRASLICARLADILGRKYEIKVLNLSDLSKRAQRRWAATSNFRERNELCADGRMRIVKRARFHVGRFFD